MQKLLIPLKWVPVDNDNENDLVETKSPIHDYIVEGTGDTFNVRYYNRISAESNNCPDFDSESEAKTWVQEVHAEEKIRAWLLEEPVSALAHCAMWFKTAYPTPVLENVVVQLGVHIEEVSEMFAELEGYEELVGQLKLIGNEFKASLPVHMDSMALLLQDEDKSDRYIDSLVDQIVTATGELTHMGVSIERVLARVNASNYSKFVDGKAVRHTPNGKIQKGPGYFEPNLKAYFEVSGEALLKSVSDQLADNSVQ